MDTNRSLRKTLWHHPQLSPRRKCPSTGDEARVVGVTERGQVLSDTGVDRHHRRPVEKPGGVRADM